jgi:MFS family permease
VGQWSGLTSIAAAVGPLVGGLLVEASWRWVFVINIPIAVAVIILSPHVPETSDPDAEGTPLDVPGAVFAVLALGGLSVAMTQGPNGGFGVLDWLALVLALASVTALVVFERKASHPMVPFQLFANRAFTASNAVTLLVYGGMGLVFFLLAIQLQVTSGWSPLQAGAALLPITVLLLFLSPSVGDLAQRIGPRWLLTAGPALIAIGMLLCIRIGPDASFLTDVLPALTVFGLGLGLSVAPVTATGLASVPEERSGAASGANNAIARTGQLLSVAAVPPLVGLTGDALNAADQLNAGFGSAMVVAAVLVGSGGLISALFLRRADLTEGDQW